MTEVTDVSLHGPTEDADERAMFMAFLVADDFRAALLTADSVGRALQIRDRVQAVVEDFMHVENEALAVAAALVGKP